MQKPEVIPGTNINATNGCVYLFNTLNVCTLIPV
jgi:hypothetical protein